MDPNDIAHAFNQQNDKRNWKARAIGTNRKDSPVQLVNFSSTGGMVALEYDCETGKFAVKFNRFTGAWGDYIKAIARSLHVVLNTLKSAGLPFDAPPTLASIVVEAVTTDDNTVHVRWQNPDKVDLLASPLTFAPEGEIEYEPVAACAITEAIMPELRERFTPPFAFSHSEPANAATFPGGDFAWMDAAKYEAPTFEGDGAGICITCGLLGYPCAAHDPDQQRLPDIL